MLKSAIQAGAHATLGGLQSSGLGRNFGSGFASGGVSSLSGSLSGSFGDVGQLLSGTIGGGLSSLAAGGDFLSGLRQGGITTGLNHLAHQSLDNISDPGKPLKPGDIVRTGGLFGRLHYVTEDGSLAPVLGGAADVGPGKALKLIKGASKYYKVGGKWTRIKLFRKIAKTDFSKMRTSRGKPFEPTSVNPQPKSRWVKIWELFFGNFDPPR